MSEALTGPDVLTLTADIVAAFVSNNPLKPDDLPKLIADTYASLNSAATSPAPPSKEPQASEFTPAVSIRKSLAKPEAILSLIDGKPYRSLTRHLSARGLTPEEYRARYKLPKDYPMVAPAYSEARREMAKRLGLGRKPKGASGAPKRNSGRQSKASQERKR